MATYKKRGYKPKKEKIKVENDELEVEDIDINEEDSDTAKVFNTLDETANKAEEFVARNQKNIIIAIGAIAAIVLGYIGYKEFIAKPAQENAMASMYQAQKYFNEAVNGTAKDSLYNLALNGGEGALGMLQVVKEYSGTPAGNLASYYAGISYLNLKDYKNAVDYLSKFSSEDEILAPTAKGAIGDAFVQLNQQEDALGYYKEAAQMRTNEYSTPMYLYKAGITALNLGKTSEALTLLKRIKDEFPKSNEAKNVDVFIGKAQAMVN